MIARCWRSDAAGFAQPRTAEAAVWTQFTSLVLGLAELGGGVATRADAVGDADAAVGVAGESESGQLLAQAFHAIEALEMSDAVLRHGRLPFVDASEERFGAQAQDLLQFVAHDPDDLVVGELPDVFCIPSSEKATQQVRGRQARDGEICCERMLRPASACLRCAAREIRSQAAAIGGRRDRSRGRR